jgi:Lrp/AsnC ligand binding domain
LITGRYDFVVHVAVRDMIHLKNLALDKFTSRPEVTRIETSIIYDYGANAALPDYCEPPQFAKRRQRAGRTRGRPGRGTRA